jgi:hypothetical protein
VQEGRRVQLLARVRLSPAMVKSPFQQGRLGRLGWNGMDWNGSRAFSLTDVQPCFYFALTTPLLFCFLTDSLEG